MLNITKQIFAGIDTSIITDSMHIAEIFPAGDTARELNKVKKVAALGVTIEEFENIPLPGFTLHSSVYKSWTNDRQWLVIDPRGFLVKITSDNLSNILMVTGITEGLIQQKCIWIRDDNSTKMSLMPISSEKYITAIKNTKLIEEKVNMEDVEIGDTVLLQNNMVGVYKGVLTLYGPLMDAYKKVEMKPQIMHKRQIVEIDHHKFFHHTNVKVLKILKKGTPTTLEESCNELNNKISLGAVFSASDYFPTIKFSSRGDVRLVSMSNTKIVKLDYEEITRQEADTLYLESRDAMDSGQMICEAANGKMYVVNHSHSSIVKFRSLDTCNLCEIHPELYSDMVILQNPRDAGNRNNVDKLVKFYKITKTVKNDRYI